MGFIEHIRSKTAKFKGFESFNQKREMLMDSICSTLDAKYEFLQYINLSAIDLIHELDAYNETYATYCRAYYENEFISKHSNNENPSDSIFKQIDTLMATIYESKPVDDSEVEKKQHQLTVENAKKSIDIILQEKGTITIRTYINNCRAMKRIKPYLDPYSRPIIATKFPKAKQLYATYMESKQRAEAYHQVYLLAVQELKETYPNDSKCFEDITLPSDMYFKNAGTFRIVDEFLNLGEITSMAKELALSEFTYLQMRGHRSSIK